MLTMHIWKIKIKIVWTFKVWLANTQMSFRSIVSDTIQTHSSHSFNKTTSGIAINWLGKNCPTWKPKTKALGPVPITILFWSSFQGLSSFNFILLLLTALIFFSISIILQQLQSCIINLQNLLLFDNSLQIFYFLSILYTTLFSF